jgi:hypothetical protein
MGEKIGAERVVEKFAAVVALHTLDDFVELGGYKLEKALDDVGGVTFITKREGPGVVGVVIKDDKIVFVSGEARDR